MAPPLIGPIHAVLFDLDGTLVDSSADITAAANAALTALGRAPLRVHEVMPHVGRGARVLLSRLTGLTEDDPSLARGVEHFISCYDAGGASLSHLYPGVVEWLEALDGVALAVVSNKPEVLVHRTLRAAGVDHHFPVVLGGDSLPLKKPDPLPVQVALERLGVGSIHAVMVGDSPMDVEAGRRAGTWTCGVRWGFGQPTEPAPDALLLTPGEFFSAFRCTPR